MFSCGPVWFALYLYPETCLSLVEEANGYFLYMLTLEIQKFPCRLRILKATLYYVWQEA